MTAAQKIGGLLAVAALATACVHAEVARTGRLALGDGREGYAPVLTALPATHEEVARIAVAAGGLATDERLVRHLRRRASLLGCSGVIQVVVDRGAASGTCVRAREPRSARSAHTRVAPPPASLLERAARAGAEGQLVLSVLAQSQQRQGAARAWPLQWFLSNYPDSAFAPDLAALLVEAPRVAAIAPPVSVRGAPQLD